MRVGAHLKVRYGLNPDIKIQPQGKLCIDDMARAV